MLPSSQDLIYFVAIAEAGSLTAAASKLGVAQPSLTLAMQRLESDLDAKLFERTQRGIRLTAAGDRVLQAGRALKESWQEIRNQVHETQHEVAGRVLLGCHAAVATYVLPAIVPALQKKFPAVELILRHDLSRHLTTAIVERDIDVGLVINPIRHPDLVLRPLLTDEVGFWVHKDLAAKGMAFEQIIADPDLIQAQTLLRKIASKKPARRPVLATSHLEIVVSLTLAKAGIGILPQRVAQAQGRKELKQLKDFPTFKDELCLAYRPERKKRPAVKALIELIQSIDFESEKN